LGVERIIRSNCHWRYEFWACVDSVLWLAQIYPMPNLLDEPDRNNIKVRITRLHHDTPRQWGTMTAALTTCHLTDQLRVAMDEIPARRRGNILTRTLIKWYVLNFVTEISKGKIKTVSEMQSTDVGDWENDIHLLCNAIDRFPRCQQFAPHPVFGPMSPTEWGKLGYIHLDHHLRQFGV
jgi:hypothetical protein